MEVFTCFYYKHATRESDVFTFLKLGDNSMDVYEYEIPMSVKITMLELIEEKYY